MNRTNGRYAAGLVALAAVLCLLAGFLVAGGLEKKLAISYHDKQVAPESPVIADDIGPERPLAPLGAVAVQGGRPGDPLLEHAQHRLRSAASGRRQAGAPVRVAVTIRPTPGANPEAYAITRAGSGLTVTASDRRGAAYGLFAIARDVDGGRDWTHPATGRLVTPRMSQRFVDAGAVGIPDETGSFQAQTDYQHNVGPLSTVVRGEAPYVDEQQLAVVQQQWRDYVDRVVAMGYNGVYVPGFLEYVDFDGVGDGAQVYGRDSIERAQHRVMRERIAPMYKYAHDMGLKVVFRTDMLALSAPLERHLTRSVGSLDTNDPRLWQVYRAGANEFFQRLPWADGLQIRIGEGGSIYNAAGWNYYSALKVTDPKGVKAMLDTFTGAAAEYGKTIWFRTWSVGVGTVGDMHTNPATYAKVLDDVHAPNLVVSTKFVSGDFDSYLQLNETLRGGRHRRIIEMQGRREFEAFGSIPNDVNPMHQQALQRLLAANPRIEGLWLWTQDGGPVHAGPQSLYPRVGFWQLYDLNAYAAGRLAWDPDVPLATVEGDWIRATFSRDPVAVRAVGQVLARSRAAVLDGLYIHPYATRQVKALGLEPPPMMWIFKWDLVSGDSAALSAVSFTSRGQIADALARGERAVAEARRMRDDLGSADRSRFRDLMSRDRLEQALTYEVDLLSTLNAYRRTALSFYEWLDTGSAQARARFDASVGAYHRAVAQHEEAWAGNLQTPPYVFDAADQGVAHMERNGIGTWVARILLVLGLAGLVFVRPLRRGALTPWRSAGEVPRRQRVLVLALPALAIVGSRLALSGALSWTYLLATLGSLGLLALVSRALLRWLRPGVDPIGLWSVLGGALLLRSTLLCAALAVRGPLGYWYRFFTDAPVRTAYVTVAVAAFLWVFVALAVCLRCRYAARRRSALGVVALTWGVPVLALGGLLAAFGLETSLTVLNDQMAVLPMGLSRILGLTVHLGIPQSLPTYLLGAGAALTALGLIAQWRGRAALPVEPDAGHP